MLPGLRLRVPLRTTVRDLYGYYKGCRGLRFRVPLRVRTTVRDLKSIRVL